MIKGIMSLPIGRAKPQEKMDIKAHDYYDKCCKSHCYGSTKQETLTSICPYPKLSLFLCQERADKIP
jgi:hypothetical protein